MPEMTGLERLRELVCDMYETDLWSQIRSGMEYKYGTANGDGKTINGLLSEIADQIERETIPREPGDGDVGPKTLHTIALTLLDDWEREAVERERDRRLGIADDVSMSAYDLLPADERDAIAWVRDHGGLDSVKRLLYWVVGHCSTRQQLDFDFWLSGRVMHELGFDEDMADRDEVERRLLARLMPDGYEWPRYESGEPLRYEDRYVYDGREREVWHVDFDSYGEPTILNKDGTRFHPDKGERVNRPAPKVLDADGVEIYKGRIAYGTRGRKYRVTELCEYEPSIVHAQAIDDGELGDEFIAANTGLNSYQLDASKLTHERPVLDADGVEVEVGDDLYSVDGMLKFHVSAIDKWSGRIATEVMSALKWADPKMYTHRAPVLASDGRPLREGETVWDVLGKRRFKVLGFGSDAKLGEFTVKTAGIDGMSLEGYSKPSDLTHERPDSWERLEEDASGIERDCGGTWHKPDGSSVNVVDLVRRAKALAGVSE